MISILQCSDLHLLPKGQRAFGEIDSFQILQNLAAFLPRLKVDIEAVIFTGDIFQDGAGASCKQDIIEVFKEYETFFLPGNHDSDLMISTLNAGHSFIAGRNMFVRDWPECRVIGLDTTSGKHYGLLSGKELEWLETQIRTEKLILLFMHHPPVKAYNAFMDQHLEGLSGLKEILKKRISKVQIYCGHLHRALITEYVGCPVFCCPALSFEMELDFTHEGGNHYVEGVALAALHTIETQGSVTSQILQIPGAYSFRSHAFL